MSASWIQDRRRKQAAGYKDDVNASLSDVMGGLEASLAVPETERKRKLAEEAAAGELGAKKSASEASLLRAKTDNTRVEESMLRRKGEESSRTARDDAKKAEADAKAKAEGTKNAESVLRKRAASGAPIETLIGAASADENLGEMDDDAVRGIQAEEAAKKEASTAKVDADKALARQRDADAEKLLRKPVAKAAKPVNPDATRKLKAEADKAEAEAKKAQREVGAGGNATAAGGKAGGAMPGELAEKRALKVQGLTLLGRLRDAKKKVGTGPVEGRVKDALGEVISNPDRKEFLQLDNSVQRIAGRILEGGKLAEGDARVYEKYILGSKLDDGDYERLLDSIQTMLEDDLTAFDQEMNASGRATGPRSMLPKSTAIPDDVAAVPPAKAKEPTAEEDTARLAAIAARKAELKAKR